MSFYFLNVSLNWWNVSSIPVLEICTDADWPMMNTNIDSNKETFTDDSIDDCCGVKGFPTDCNILCFTINIILVAAQSGRPDQMGGV